jgi:hypothetical protein
MDGEDPAGEILVFMGELRGAGVGEYSALIKGGLLGLTSTWGGRQQGFLMPYLVDVNRTLDTERLGVWDDGRVFVDFQQAGSTQHIANYIPDFWVWDALSTGTQNYTEFAQYWYEQSFGWWRSRVVPLEQAYRAFRRTSHTLLARKYPRRIDHAFYFFEPREVRAPVRAAPVP